MSTPSFVNAANVDDHAYILGAASDRERLELQHQIFLPAFLQTMELILNEYGLASRLEQLAAGSGEPSTENGPSARLRVLDVGCGEGLFLYDLAALLEARSLLATTDLNGLDADQVAINTAKEFSQVTKPPRAHFSFYHHDITQPLRENLALRLEDKLQFDFIFALALFEHIPNARHQLERLYREVLRPGGIIYIRDIFMKESASLDDPDNGWVAPHPVMTPFYRLAFSFIKARNPGVEVAADVAGWFQEMGAGQVQSHTYPYYTGDETQAGLMMTRNWFMGLRNSGPVLLARGFISQAEFDQTMQTLFVELNTSLRGRVSIIDTVARKPF